MALRKQSEKWDRFYLDLAKFVATRLSKDPSTKVGAVVVNWEKGVEDLEERYNDRSIKYPLVEHAERNAMFKAGRENCQGATLYVWPAFAFPPVCSDCGKAAIAHGIKEIVGYIGPETEATKRWEESIKFSKLMCEEAGVTWRGLNEINS